MTGVQTCALPILAFNLPQDGQSVNLKIWRDGKPLELPLTASVIQADRAEGNQYTPPRYYVYGGLVFTPLSRDYLRALGPSVSDSANATLIYELYYHPQENPQTARPEPVVLAALLPDPVNATFQARGRVMVDRVNGQRIGRLNDLVQAFANNPKAQDVIEFLPDHHLEALDRAEVAKVQADILKTYGVASDRRL